jgi:GT2 family glycosyltransferase
MVSKKKMAKQRVIVVLGMHRGGTSVVMRGIKDLGVELGEPLSQPGPDNPTGFWEHEGIVALNDRILETLGMNWHSVRQIHPETFSSSAFDPLRRQAIELVRQHFDGSPLWGFKDPRTARLLAFWKPVFLELGMEASYVLVVRNPVSISRSLFKRNGFTDEKSNFLWLGHMLSAVNEIKGHSSVFLDYDIYMETPLAELHRLANALDININKEKQKAIEEYAMDFLDNGLRHNTFDEADSLQNEGVPLLSGRVYQWLKRLAQDEADISDEETWNQFEDFSKDYTAFSSLFAYLDALDDAVNVSTLNERRFLRDNIRESDREIGRLRGAVDTITQNSKRLSEEIEMRGEEIDRLRHEIENQNEEIEKRGKEIDHLRYEIENQNEEIEKRDKEIKKRETDINRLHIDRDEAISFLDSQIDVLTEWIEHIRYGFYTVLNSRRWRVGNKIGSVVAKLLRRPGALLVIGQVNDILKGFEDWKQGRKRHMPGKTDSKIPRSVQAADTGLRNEIPKSGLNATYDLIFLANIDWHARYQRPQQMATQFARNGHRVFYVVASEILTSSGPQGFRASQVAPSIYEVQLSGARQVNRYSNIIDSETTEMFLLSMENMRREFGIVDAVLVVHLPFWTPFALQLSNRWHWLIVYDCMDEWEDFPAIGKPLLEAEKDLIEKSDLITVTAALLQEKWLGKGKREPILIRNGVDYDFFAEHCQPNNTLGHISHPVIGYYGALAEWVDFSLVVRLAQRRPDWNFVFLGDVFVTDLCGLDEMENVHILGRKPYTEMPLYLYHFDVCIIPFVLNKVTHAVDPVKFYEFICGGKPVVSVPLSELKIYADHMYFAETSEQFIGQIEIALEENDVEHMQQRRELAKRNDWGNRYNAMHLAIVDCYEKITIIMVTYKNVDLTRLCVESILHHTTYPNYEIILVDNHSTDGTPNYLHYLRNHDERIKIIINKENRGFAAANNQGLKIAKGTYLVLLNNDTIVPRGWLVSLLRYLGNEEIGLVGPVTNFAGNEAKVDVPYKDIGGMPAFAEQYMREHQGDYFDIKVLAMYCVAMRKDVFEQVGPLDEDFEVGMFEDDDYCRRVREKGYRVVCAEDSFVHHFGQAAFKELLVSGEYQKIWDSNQKHFEKKWGRWQPHKHRDQR